MSVIIQPKSENCLHELRNICTVKCQKGLIYPYNNFTKIIEMEENETDKVEVFSIASTSNRVIMAIPFDTGKRFLEKGGIVEEFNVAGYNERMVFAGKLRDYQANDLKSIILQMKTKGCCYFKAFPGYGKTVLMSYIISVFKEKACIVVPNISLAEQTRKSLNVMLPNINVYILGTDRIIPEDTDVVICFFRRINGTSTPFLNFKTIIFDEVHMLSTSLGIAGMLTLRPVRLLALTATGGERNNITELFVGRCSIEPSIKKRWYISFPQVRTNLQGYKYFGTDGYTRAINDLTTSEPYMRTAVEMIKYWNYMEKRIIVITMRIDARDRIAELIEESNKKVRNRWEIVKILKEAIQMKKDLSKEELIELFNKYNTPFIDEKLERIIELFDNGENEINCGVLGNESRKCGNCDVIVGTHKFIGTGFDLSNSVEGFDGKAASVMLFLGSIKDETLMHQASGRSFRNESSLAVYLSVQEVPVFIKHTEKLRAGAKSIDGCVILDKYARFLEHFNEKVEKELTNPKSN